MHTNKNRLLALGLATSLLTASAPYETAQSGEPQVISRDRVSVPVLTRNLGSLSVSARGTSRSEKSAPPAQSAKSNMLPITYFPISTSQQNDLARNQRYVSHILLPIVRRQTNLRVIEPTNTSLDPVNIPGQFIVAKTAECGSQFYVQSINSQPDEHNISVSVFGKLDVLSNGMEYGKAAYSSHRGLAHTEGVMNVGKNFLAINPTAAVAYIKKMLPIVCRDR